MGKCSVCKKNGTTASFTKGSPQLCPDCMRKSLDGVFEKLNNESQDSSIKNED